MLVQNVSCPVTFFQTTHKIFKDSQATGYLLRIFFSTMKVLNAVLDRSYLVPLLSQIKVILDFGTARKWIFKAREFISGEVFRKTVFQVASRFSLLVSELCFTVRWLDQLKLINLGKLAQTTVGRIACFLTCGMALETVRAITSFISTFFNEVEVMQSIYAKGRITSNHLTSIALDVTITASVALFLIGGPGCMLMGQVFLGIFSTIHLVRFLQADASR